MFDEAIKLYRRSLVRCLPLALIGALGTALVGAYAGGRADALWSQFNSLMNAGLIDASANPTDITLTVAPLASALHALLRSPAVWISSLGALLVVVISHGALIAHQYALATRPRASTAAALGRSLRRAPSILAALVLCALALALGVCAVIISSGAAALAVLLGLALLILYTWLWGRVQLWLVAMITQDVGAVTALASSWHLVRGHWWRVSTLVTLAYTVVGLLALLARGLSDALIGLTNGGATAGRLITDLAALVAGTLTLPMLPAVWLAIDRQLVKKNPAKGGVDFEQIAQVHRDGQST